MNKMKKFASIATAILMTACMTAPMMSSFAENYIPTIIVNGSTENHTYQAYQIFDGSHYSNLGVLTNIKWGGNIDPSKIINGSIYNELAKINIGTDDAAVYPFTKKVKKEDTEEFEQVALTSAQEVADVLDAAAKAVTSGDSTKDMEITKKFADVISNFIYAPAGYNNKYILISKYDDTNKKYTINVDEQGAGYYLVQDQDKSLEGKDEAYTRYILKVIGNGDFEITPKSTKPSVEKKVYEESLANQTGNIYGAGYNDVADYDIGDMVPFKLYGSIPSDAKEFDEYDHYFYQFNDKLDKRFNFIENNDLNSRIHVYYEENNGTKREIVNRYPYGENNDEYDKTHIVLKNSSIIKGFNASDNTITVTIEDIKEFAKPGEGRITVEYKAQLSEIDGNYRERATVGYDGQVNSVYLKYSNDVNEEYKPTKDDVELTHYDKPESQGQTPVDGVIVFTYGIGINKVIEEANGELGAKLAGAKFAVYCDAYEIETIPVTETVTVKAPTTDNPDAEENVVVTSEITKEYEVWTLKDTSGDAATEKTYYKNGEDWYTKGEDGKYNMITDENAKPVDKDNVTLTRNKAYIKTNASYTDQYDDFLNEPPNIDTESGNGTNGVWISNDTNNIVIKGLDKGRVYYIEELKAPEGYNKLDNPVKFEIISTYTGSGETPNEIYPKQNWIYSEEGNYQEGMFTALDDIHLIVDDKEQGKIKYNPSSGDSSSTSDSVNTGSDGSSVSGGGNSEDNNLGIINIGNRSGAELPDTGGIGTTLFYLGGSVMVAVAGVFLITNKRASRKKD